MDCVADESVAEPPEHVDDGEPVVVDADVTTNDVVHLPGDSARDGDSPCT